MYTVKKERYTCRRLRKKKERQGDKKNEKSGTR